MVFHRTAEFCKRCKFVAALIVAAFKIINVAGNCSWYMQMPFAITSISFWRSCYNADDLWELVQRKLHWKCIEPRKLLLHVQIARWRPIMAACTIAGCQLVRLMANLSRRYVRHMSIQHSEQYTDDTMYVSVCVWYWRLHTTVFQLPFKHSTVL